MDARISNMQNEVLQSPEKSMEGFSGAGILLGIVAPLVPRKRDERRLVREVRKARNMSKLSTILAKKHTAC